MEIKTNLDLLDNITKQKDSIKTYGKELDLMLLVDLSAYLIIKMYCESKLRNALFVWGANLIVETDTFKQEGGKISHFLGMKLIVVDSRECPYCRVFNIFNLE